MKSIVVIPTYNEKENIKKIIPKIANLNLGLDILVVDDNSPDQTAKVVNDLKSLVEKNGTKIFVLNRKNKKGLGRAYLSGFKWALKKEYKVIIQMDADLSHNPDYIVKMLEDINEHDLIIGSRYIKGGGTKGWGTIRRLLSRGGSLYAKIILGSRLNDLTGGFKCWKANLLKSVDLDTISSNGYSFQIEMNFRADKLNAKIKELPIIFVDRDVGKSKMSKKIIIEAFWKVWILKLSKKPWLKNKK